MDTVVSVLFARPDSVYKTLPGCDVFDVARDARSFPGRGPVVAHPPCRAWGRLRKFAKPVKGERALAVFAVRQVRACGGVLEHPAGSILWKRAGLPAPGQVDKFGGFTLGVNQSWFGHRAEKSTLLYICGRDPRGLPPIPLSLEEPSHVVQGRGSRPHISKAEREHTPVVFAQWLLDVARGCCHEV